MALHLAVALGGAVVGGYAYSLVAPDRIPVFSTEEYPLSFLEMPADPRGARRSEWSPQEPTMARNPGPRMPWAEPGMTPLT